MLDALNLFWIDLMFLFVSMALLKGAGIGECHSVGRGGSRASIAKVTSMPACATYLLMAGGPLA
jgi:hypothetical protein